MPEFKCIVCDKAFSIPEQVLEQYPNWKPKYCQAHNPKKKQSAEGKQAAKKPSFRASSTGELDLPLAEVLTSFTEGPDSGIFTDGSARPNPGPGGWGVVRVKKGEIIAQHYGNSPDTTNNRMELTALIEAFKLVDPAEAEEIYTDSELCVNILTKWAANWKKNNWKKKGGEIKNLELVQELYELYLQRPQVKLAWVRAHNGWLWNEYADSLSTAWARETL